ncbi:hypothetical protein NQ314_016484 [Rhamnusium bicolor]|uniref:DDE Tnp4 domain-containing protein n=1 Tax=Rhamnusium bicolor TaxID=1586634 RepID=A0AAV8WWY3_9CUCU|nr:hypothetical protein NQ314_016484 [Rhamnusium bicolor]
MVGVTEEGAITFVSDIWGGAISDRQILEKFGILDLFSEGMFVLADRGFDVSDLLENKGVHLNIPPFKKSAPQLTDEEVAKTRSIANRRIVVEDIIGLVKVNKILVQKMPQHL